MHAAGAPDNSLIPKPYRTSGETSVYRVPVHFIRSGMLGRRPCEWSGRDALPGELDNCPVHGPVRAACEVNPDHLMAKVPAVTHIDTTSSAAVPACRNCAAGALSSRLIG